jgi:hypothetical protein
MSEEASRMTQEATAESCEKSKAKRQKIIDFNHVPSVCRKKFSLKDKDRHRYDKDHAEDLDTKRIRGDSRIESPDIYTERLDRHIRSEKSVKKTKSNSTEYFKISSGEKYSLPVFERKDNEMVYRGEIEQLLASLELDIKQTREMLASARRQFS